eukprot:2891399-Amphidinium_carterae.1
METLLGLYQASIGPVLSLMSLYRPSLVGLTIVPTNLSVGSAMITAVPSSASNTATWLAHT